jgi:hypothetical protein
MLHRIGEMPGGGMTRFARLVVAAVCIVMLLGYVTAAHAVQLVTEQEAMLPDDPTKVRGVTRGPDIDLLSPAPYAGLVRSPLRLKIKLKAHGGSSIDRDSILVTYWKIPAIDVTQRILSFIRGDGIEIPTAELPLGTHHFKIEVRDNEGRKGAQIFTISVGK